MQEALQELQIWFATHSLRLCAQQVTFVGSSQMWAVLLIGPTLGLLHFQLHQVALAHMQSSQCCCRGLKLVAAHGGIVVRSFLKPSGTVAS